jgi:hypothetical protein
MARIRDIPLPHALDYGQAQRLDDAALRQIGGCPTDSVFLGELA